MFLAGESVPVSSISLHSESIDLAGSNPPGRSHPNAGNHWQRIEADPLSREKLEARISSLVTLMLRCEAGEHGATEKLRAAL